MVKKSVVLAVFFMALCFAGVGCFRGGAYVGVDDTSYYDGPYRFDGGSYYYYNGGFYSHDGRAFRFHHDAPQDQRAYYDGKHRKNREEYNRNYPNWRDQHPEHPWSSPRLRR